MNSTLQIFFCKPPVAGRVKTRLGEFLGMGRARDLYAAILSRVAGAFPFARIRLYSETGENIPELTAQIPGAVPGDVRIQSGATLGERMARALREVALDPTTPPEVDRILLTGTDIPAYTPELARTIASFLDRHDFALAPTPDGGYYCVGARRSVLREHPRLEELFAGIPWSTSRVFRLQIENLEGAGLSVARGPECSDLDTIYDLIALRREGRSELNEFFPDIRAVLPVFNEEPNLEFVLAPLFASGLFREIICADNNSRDGSVALARELGARVTHCAERGYGATCLTALEDIAARGGCDVVLFLDADGADDPAGLYDLLAPVVSGRVDFALGHRRADLAEPGALLPQARFGNALVSLLTRMLWGFQFHDLGPFRAIHWEALQKLGMDDRNFGWTIQMQVRALGAGLRILEIPVSYRKRHAGESKVTASVRGAVLAGFKILYTVGREWLRAVRTGNLPDRRTHAGR